MEELNWNIRNLNEIATEIYSGNEITKDQLGTGDYPAIRFNQIFNSRIEIKEGESFVNPDLIKNKRYADYGDLLIATTSNIKENLGRGCVYLGKEKCLIGNHVLVIKCKQNTKYLTYCLSTKFSKYQIKKLANKSTVYDLYLSEIKQIKIPIPSLEEQEKIVKMLDKFHLIINDLEGGIPWLIASNKRQYEYFREKIFEI